jgi:hypothetical protein
MPKATPPDLRDDGQHGRELARRYLRGVRIDPHAHDWAQVLYAVAGAAPGAPAGTDLSEIRKRLSGQ